MLIVFEPKQTWDCDDACPLGTETQTRKGKTSAIYRILLWHDKITLGYFFPCILCDARPSLGLFAVIVPQSEMSLDSEI